MAKSRSSKIFVKNGDDIRVLMWAVVGSDGSVMMGFPWESNETVALVMDENFASIKMEDLVTKGYIGKSKISFHKSGHCKFICRMGKDEESIDRVTVTGPPFEDISSPHRMAELLLPHELPNSNYCPTDRDTVIDVTGSYTLPTRCTIACVGNDEFKNIIEKDSRFVDTSIWEAWNALENDNHTWVWTLRRSRDDVRFADKVYVTIPGRPKWGVE